MIRRGLIAVYVVVGVIVANSHHYFKHLNGAHIAAASDTAAVKAAWTRVADDLGLAALAIGRGASAATNELVAEAAGKAREAANSCG